jgi:hypothetical protein
LPSFRPTLSGNASAPQADQQFNVEGATSEDGASRVRSPKRSLCAEVSFAAAALVCSAPAFASSCEDLANLKLTDTTIETAETVPAGDSTTSDKDARKGMPAFPVHPSFGSHISMRMSESGASFTEVLGSDWDWRKFDLDLDMPKVDAELGPILNGAATGDLSQFKARGGKLIIFQGWADPIVAPAQTIALYKGLSDKFGGDQETQKFARLFMAPGAGHCGLGGGLNAMQRPLCPHPQKAWYKGGGDPNIAANYICAVDNK